jgi:hypothetical protein
MKPTASPERGKTRSDPQEAAVRYRVGGQDEYRLARMFNSGGAEMYMELNFPPPKLGASLHIEVLNGFEGEPWLDGDVPGTRYCAEVIWKRNLPGSEAGYGVGLRCVAMSSPEN